MVAATATTAAGSAMAAGGALPALFAKMVEDGASLIATDRPDGTTTLAAKAGNEAVRLSVMADPIGGFRMFPATAADKLAGITAKKDAAAIKDRKQKRRRPKEQRLRRRW